MVYEDFTTYTEVDPNNHITVSPSRVTASSWRNEDAYVYKDYGVDHFGNFEHLVTVRVDNLDHDEEYTPYLLANAINDRKGLRDAQQTHIALIFYATSAGVRDLYLQEWYSLNAYSDSYGISEATDYYLTIQKSGTSLTCKIYSDAARTNLLATLSLTLHADHKFRYLYAFVTFNDNNVNQPSSGYTENLDLQEAVPVVRKIMGDGLIILVF